MTEKDEALRCWCCKNYLVRFDDDIAPQKIKGGICVLKRKECKLYDEKCDRFSIKVDLLPKSKELHSADAYIKRNNLSYYDEFYEEASKNEI